MGSILAGRMPQRDLVHFACPSPGSAGGLAARWQQRQATLQTGREYPAEIAGQRVVEACPQDTLPSHQTTIMKSPECC